MMPQTVIPDRERAEITATIPAVGYVDIADEVWRSADEATVNAILDVLSGAGVRITGQYPHAYTPGVTRLLVAGPCIVPGRAHVVTCHRHEDGTVTAEITPA